MEEKKQVIPIDKKNAFNRINTDLLISFFMNTLIWTIILVIIMAVIGINTKENGMFVMFGLVFLFGIIYGIKVLFAFLQMKSLEQSYTSHEMRTSYKVILNHINVARLQIINNVKIKQGFIDKLFNLYRVEVDYGFGDTGYTHVFYYLTLEQAEKIAEDLRIKTDLGVLLRKGSE